jgi:hypothetical protein
MLHKDMRNRSGQRRHGATPRAHGVRLENLPGEGRNHRDTEMPIGEQIHDGDNNRKIHRI